jgi:putative transposase
VGWAMSRHIDTTFVQDALKMALGRRNPSAGLLHHSHRGSQDARHAYQGGLAAQGIRCRLRGKGEGLDNAVAERFFGNLTQERTSHSRHFQYLS